MTEGSPALPSFAGALLLWYVSGLVRACMGGMNSIYEADEKRTLLQRWSLSLALAVCVTVAVVLSVLAVTVGPRIDRSGAFHVLLLVLRWPFAVVALGLVLMGVEIDELLRKDASAGEKRVLGVLRG